MAVNQKNTKPGQPDDFLRIQDLLYLCLARWKWFVLSLAITTGVAAVYLLCTPAVYTRTASVLIKEDSKGKSVSPDLESFSEFGLSPKYLSAVSKSICGYTVQELVFKAIIRKSISLLKNTQKDIQEISNAFGFPNASYFGTFFKKQVGVSPQQYRKNL